MAPDNQEAFAIEGRCGTELLARRAGDQQRLPNRLSAGIEPLPPDVRGPGRVRLTDMQELGLPDQQILTRSVRQRRLGQQLPGVCQLPAPGTQNLPGRREAGPVDPSPTIPSIRPDDQEVRAVVADLRCGQRRRLLRQQQWGIVKLAAVGRHARRLQLPVIAARRHPNHEELTAAERHHRGGLDRGSDRHRNADRIEQRAGAVDSRGEDVRAAGAVVLPHGQRYARSVRSAGNARLHLVKERGERLGWAPQEYGLADSIGTGGRRQRRDDQQHEHQGRGKARGNSHRRDKQFPVPESVPHDPLSSRH